MNGFTDPTKKLKTVPVLPEEDTDALRRVLLEVAPELAVTKEEEPRKPDPLVSFGAQS